MWFRQVGELSSDQYIDLERDQAVDRLNLPDVVEHNIQLSSVGNLVIRYVVVAIIYVVSPVDIFMPKVY